MCIKKLLHLKEEIFYHFFFTGKVFNIVINKQKNFQVWSTLVFLQHKDFYWCVIIFKSPHLPTEMAECCFTAFLTH